ncbi:Uncharacterised protein [Clostridium paraputrificum]|uniref:hypothetical protein n=1 Tax=Clostridium paraputrificum TaxID=29363 RepID=UPI0006C1DB66|nr:hypothetical protein [Clostridium paraputrificum]CUQ09234.1 Uncharacterised protein [Clostridium paraputrificum]
MLDNLVINRIMNKMGEDKYYKLEEKIKEKYSDINSKEDIQLELDRVKFFIKTSQSPFFGVFIALYLTCIPILIGELIEANWIAGLIYMLVLLFVLGYKYIIQDKKYELYCICEKVLEDKLKLIKSNESDDISDIKKFLGI